jgi:hypothetical protein
MTTTTRVPERDDTKYEYSIVPIINGAHRWGQRLFVGNYINAGATGEKRCVHDATALMESRAEVERVHVYLSHPSPGPMDRYAGRILRGEQSIRRPT